MSKTPPSPPPFDEECSLAPPRDNLLGSLHPPAPPKIGTIAAPALFRQIGTLAPEDEPLDEHDTAPLDDRVGWLIGGRYELEALLGAGGMGRVYRARHIELGEPVAVKFLHAEWSTKPELRARFRREAVVLAKLRHPGIVSVIDFGEHQGELYLVMELLRGFSLDTQITAGGSLLPLYRVVTILDQVLQVLEAAHAAGVVHRDLKPENVMLLDAGDRTDKVKVLDFGIASLQGADGQVEKLTQAGAVRGTPQYMAPEQCVGRNITPAVDIYATGTILYELLTGVTPFTGRSPAEVMSAQIFQQAPPIAEQRVSGEPVPAGVEMLMHRALSKRPEVRPTAAEFRDGLELAFRGHDVVSIAARDAADRGRSAGMSRDERALTPERDARSEQPANLAAPNARVGLVGFSPERLATLRTALSTVGITAHPVGDGVLPSGAPDRHPWKAFVFASDATAAARTASAKKDATVGKVPVVVIDLADAAAGTEYIRAGASDVALARLDDPAVCQKILRVVRRGR